MTKKRIAIICMLDGYANSVRPTEVKKYLEHKGHTVSLIDTFSIYKLDKSTISLAKKYLLLFIGFFCKAIGGISFVAQKYFGKAKKNVYADILILQMKLRGYYLYQYLNCFHYDVVFCESPFDSYVLTLLTEHTTIFDSPTPWGHELYYGGYFSKEGFEKFKRFEKKIYKQVQHLSFHWQSYTHFIRESYYDGPNIFILNYGIYEKPERVRAAFKSTPRVVFLGYLGGPWVNLPLLSRLTQIYPYIDVYGGPKPDKKYKLNYKGYAPSLDILGEYQFGLITLTNDPLRKVSFSSKQLEYISYGLPVFVPDWKINSTEIAGCILYKEETFLKQLKEYSEKFRWQKVANAAYDESKNYNWKKVLEPLDKVL